MDLNNYHKFVKSVWKPLERKQDGIVHAALGLSGETGEVVDALKKHVFYGKELDLYHVQEEVGDIMFYLIALCNEVGIHVDDVLDHNVTKLSKRYPSGKFSEAEAIARADKNVTD